MKVEQVTDRVFRELAEKIAKRRAVLLRRLAEYDRAYPTSFAPTAQVSENPRTD